MNGVITGVKAAIFDLDGTLFDSTRLWADIDVRFLRRRGLEPTPEYKRAIAALGNRAGAKFTVEYYRLSETPEQLMREWADMALYEYRRNIRLFDGVREYLEAAAHSGVTLVALTSLARELAEPCLQNNGISPLFRALITADETGLSKTSPEIYTYTADFVGAPPAACVAYDDVAAAIRSAKLAGMTTVAVRGDGSYNDYTDISRSDADYSVVRLFDAPKLCP